MKKLVISGGIALLTIPSLIYYTTKYYIDGSLNFDNSMIVMFTIICSLLIIGMLLNIYNAYQNKELRNQISDLKEFIKECHYDNLEYHENNRDILLDLDKGGN